MRRSDPLSDPTAPARVPPRLLGFLLCFLSAPLPAGAVERDEEPGPTQVRHVDPVERVARREVVLSARASEASLRARASALHAYRLARRGSARFLVAPDARGKDARATTAALLVFQRYAHEASALRVELARARDERQALETSAAVAMAAAAVTPGQSPGTDVGSPARGTIVARPGVRRDPATSALHRVTGLEILSRLNQPIEAPRDGVVRRVELLPQGGFAVVITHDNQLVTVLTGLRRVDVEPGDAVLRGQAIGVCGRNLDGAPMMTFELWKSGVPVDPDALMREGQPRDRATRRSRKSKASDRAAG